MKMGGGDSKLKNFKTVPAEYQVQTLLCAGRVCGSGGVLSQVTDRLNETHPHWEGHSALLCISNQTSTSSGNTLTDLPRITFNHIAKQLWPIQSDT